MSTLVTEFLPLKTLIKAAGGNTAIAAAAIIRGPDAPAVTSQNISKWEGVVPIDYVGVVSELSGIPRHLIRPDRPDLFPPPKKEKERAA